MTIKFLNVFAMALTESKSKVKLKKKSFLDKISGHKTNGKQSVDDSAGDDFVWYLAFISITVLAFGTRLYKITEPNHVWYAINQIIY